MSIHRLFYLTLAALPLLVTSAAAQDTALYRSWDRNRDGVVTRSEWRGTAREFRNLDGNRDGVLSRDELRADSADEGDTFQTLDRNQDGQLTRNEWRGERAAFARVDRDGNNRISRGEFMNANVDHRNLDLTELEALDVNNDNLVERREWRGTAGTFNRLDANRDGVLSARELRTNELRADSAERFDSLDQNGDGVLSRREWAGDTSTFTHYDRNRDGVISRREVELTNNGAYSRGNAVERNTIRVDGRNAWTNTGIYLEAGDVVTIAAQGAIQMSDNAQDRATPAGSVTGRNATNSPLPNQKAGGLLARTSNGDAGFVGDGGTFTADHSGELQLGVNDDYFQDNSGEYRVVVTVTRR
jgi:Ca2+-binding EF-hand superfamily protein